jgi:hypothetical protein
MIREKEVVQLFGKYSQYAPSRQTMRWLLAALIGLWLVCTLVVLSGCADSAYWWQRTAFGIDCRPDMLTSGQCTPVRK